MTRLNLLFSVQPFIYRTTGHAAGFILPTELSFVPGLLLVFIPAGQDAMEQPQLSLRSSRLHVSHY